MIKGLMRGDEGRIRFKVRGPNGRARTIEAVIDTGYNGYLTLPPAVIAALRLPWNNADRGVLADGSECYFNVYEGAVVWDRHVRAIPIDEADADPLLGMALMRGYELRMQVRNDGDVTIKRLRAT